ncbi:alpha,alpha-trehalose-phosphate synthase (UDP-forming) [Plastoroseomonas hellenica]|uniref:alpha,alpha-trehalose-phosphate synthase (UDP-forming) n=1 Tax=Plastoroseomonas hellenica TaxID=2687306 RepID=UPI001BA6C26B|nr:trehalose-6-phosphate synthase [Plastoroseomonas hellenica]MBR0641484.1 trehalose-6-phosphate synthase [Plastoroseomonas hellenica]
MARLVIVSNRVPPPHTRGAQAGGLTVALKDALRRREAMWFGWSGDIADPPGAPHSVTVGRHRYVTLDLTPDEERLYYTGYSNGTLWPMLHYRVGLLEFRREEEEAWRAVNERFARRLVPLLRPDDIIWVHDFHLIPLLRCLRDLGAQQRLGFFLHVPFPPPALFEALPRSEALLRDLGAADLIGMQTQGDAMHLSAALAEFGIETPVGAYPVGIDTAGFSRAAAAALTKRETTRLIASLGGRSLILGVDRLDYSKGLPHRLRGYGALLRRFPEHRKRVTFLQAAPVSRGQVAQYRALRRELDELAGRINGEHAEFDWMPLRWLTRPLARSLVAGFLRHARVGLVTPLHDGMNLVAKEFVASQDPEDPGVLVLSRFAGAAAELAGAVLVNPHDPEDITEALHQALTMPLAERRERWQGDWQALSNPPGGNWAQAFLERLSRS